MTVKELINKNREYNDVEGLTVIFDDKEHHMDVDQLWTCHNDMMVKWFSGKVVRIDGKFEEHNEER